MAKDPKARPKGRSEVGRTLSFEYLKSQFFRVIHADGAIGSVTPTGNVHIAFYSERFAIPKMTVHPHNDDGSLGEPIPGQTIGKTSVIREMDVDVVLDTEAIDGLLIFLQAAKEDLVKRQDKLEKLQSQGRKRVSH